MPARRPLSLLLALAFALAFAPALAAAQSAPVSAWPLRVDTAAGQLSVYQPQPETFEGDQLSARAAVSLLPPGATDPEFGATWFKARVFTDRDARTVTIQDLDVRQVKLPNSTPDQEAGFAAVLKGQLPQMNVTFSLDQLEASLGDVQKARAESQQLDNAPPKVIVTQTPATLVVLDGDPKLQPAEDVPGVLRVVNTPFIMLLDGTSKQYYLKTGDTWMAAPAVTGPWQSVASIPAGVAQEGSKLSVQNQQSPDQQPPAAPAPANAAATQVIVATEPTELISSDGPPQYTPLPGNNLLYMANTQSDVFMEVATQRQFVLLSGRWYAAPNLNGPWTFVAADALPPAFAQIPVGSPKANVLVSIAGTQRAQDARMDAYIPQTTAIHRDAGSSLQVSYDGDPQFVPVQGTPIAYADNCADPVLQVDRGYYCCHQAVWYQAAAAVGPWTVSVSVPQVIYTLPPSCPVYQCRYVYVYDSTPDVVYCGYLPGYTGCYVYGPTVVYGTGYRYPYWYHREFIPRPVTWGFAPRYDYYAATWGLGVGCRYDPTWFAAGPAVAVRHDWWGPSGYVGYRDIHQSRTTIINNNYGGRADVRREDIRRGPAVVNNTRNVTVNRINIYNRQENAPRNVTINNSRTTVNNSVRNADVRNTNVRENNNVRGNVPNGDRTANVHDTRGGAPAAAPRADDRGGNDVYAGRDGQVYRRTDQGWQQRGTKGWSSVNGVPDAQVNRDPTPQRNPRAEALPQHNEPTRTPTPARVEPPARAQAPARVEQPARLEPPARAEAPRSNDGGLEADHIARQRGSARRAGGDDEAGAAARGGGGGTPARGNGGNAAGGGGARGGSGGGGNDGQAGNAKGAGRNGNR